MADERAPDDEKAWRCSALSRVPRLTYVETCPGCEKPIGSNYPVCELCFHCVEDMWLADWRALLDREGISASSCDETLLAQVVMGENERHPFTVLDIAMTLQRCNTCGNELGSRYQQCTECALAFGFALAAEHGGSGNDHALHIGRWILRHPHQHSANIHIAWSHTMPRLLTGWLPTTQEAQHWMARIKAGEIAQVEDALFQLDRRINLHAKGD